MHGAVQSLTTSTSPQLPGLTNNAVLHRLSRENAGDTSGQVADGASTHLPDDNFFDMLMRCQVRGGKGLIL